jgi:AcrR family transcriptional regulator
MAIRTVALDIIAKEGLEHLTMQKLAAAAGVSPRTIYIKYESKEDLLIKLYIREVLAVYEKAVLTGFRDDMDLVTGIHLLWQNGWRFLKANRPSFALIQYGKSSPLLNRAFQQENIKQGQFFGPIHRFLEKQVQAGVLYDLPFDVLRALLFSPLLDIVTEYFDHLDRPVQLITEEVIRGSCAVVIKGIQK